MGEVVNSAAIRTCQRCIGSDLPKRDCVCAGTGQEPERHPAFPPYPVLADHRCPYVPTPTLREEIAKQVAEERVRQIAWSFRPTSLEQDGLDHICSGIQRMVWGPQ
jgi:hypothetical protein